MVGPPRQCASLGWYTGVNGKRARMRRLASVGLTQPGWAVAQNFLVLQRVMIGVPATRYAKSGDVRVACQVTGTGPVDLVWAPGTASRLDLDWEWQAKARFLARLGAFSRL